MIEILSQKNQTRSRTRPVRIGFVPLNDCAPIVMAHELGLFEKYDLVVRLSREIGWATVRDKIVYGELDAAHAVAGLVFVCSFGLGVLQTDCLTALVLNLHGNAITLSNELRACGVHDGKTLKFEIERSRGKRLFTFGVAFPFSSHNFILCEWLRAAGIEPRVDVEIVTVPPPQMFPNLRAGNLDGYCVGEPWNSLAVMRRAGWCVATSAELAPLHPEKVLIVRRDFAEEREAVLQLWNRRQLGAGIV
jgi:ABC-type nitrate/sulfonate/bicarbonate transport system substrate-binding protein